MKDSTWYIKPTTFDFADKASKQIFNQKEFENYIRKSVNDNTLNSIIHLHCCRAGPVLSNEIFISIHEKEKRPLLKKIYGIVQPGGTLGKYLTYWYGGLDKKYMLEFFQNVCFENIDISQIRSSTRTDLLFCDVNLLKINWLHGINILIKPLLRTEAKEFLSILGISASELLNYLNLIHLPNEIITIRKFMEESSLFLLNLVLKKKNLPEVELFDTDNFLDNIHIEKKYIDINLAKERLVKIKLKRSRTIQHAICEIKKKLHGYKSCNLEQFKKIFKLLSKQNNRAVSKNFISLKDAIAFYLEGKSLEQILQYSEIIFDLNDSNKLTALSVANYGQINYITGLNMIEICFQAAFIMKETLILQKFFRPGGYEKYKTMMDKYPKVCTDVSSVDIWNINLFPEYDTNLFLGMKYLKRL